MMLRAIIVVYFYGSCKNDFYKNRIKTQKTMKNFKHIIIQCLDEGGQAVDELVFDGLLWNILG